MRIVLEVGTEGEQRSEREEEWEEIQNQSKTSSTSWSPCKKRKTIMKEGEGENRID